MGIGKYCLNCGYIFRGQRVGKCPNCDQSAYTESEKFYPLSPDDIRRFEEYDKKGGGGVSLRANKRNIAIIEVPSKDKGKWVSLSVLGAHVTYADYGKGPEIIAALQNQDGFGIEDFPEKIMLEAAQTASSIMNER